MYEYQARVVRVIDADTFEFEVDLGFKLKLLETFRLGGVDAWETRGVEREDGLRAKDRVIELFAASKNEVIVRTAKGDGKGKYGRWIADVYVDVDGEYQSLGEILVEEDHAEPYRV